MALLELDKKVIEFATIKNNMMDQALKAYVTIHKIDIEKDVDNFNNVLINKSITEGIDETITYNNKPIIKTYMKLNIETGKGEINLTEIWRDEQNNNS